MTEEEKLEQEQRTYEALGMIDYAHYVRYRKNAISGIDYVW